MFQDTFLREAESGAAEGVIRRANQEDLEYQLKNNYSLLIGPTVDDIGDLFVNLQSCLKEEGLEHVYTDEDITTKFPQRSDEFEHILGTMISCSTVVIVFICESSAAFKSWMYDPLVTQVVKGRHPQGRVIPVLAAGFKQLTPELQRQKLRKLFFSERGSWQNKGGASSVNKTIVEAAKKLVSVFDDIKSEAISDQLTGDFFFRENIYL